jgi:dephospho-CoA kinase
MVVIGVTGGVGTGKSTVCRMLGQLGAVVVDADETVHRLLLVRDGPVVAMLLAEFGPGILTAEGQVDRRELGRRAFADAGLTAKLNSIVHPAVTRTIRDELKGLSAAGTETVALDAPLLFESGLDELCDQVWVVTADPVARRGRLERRDGLAADEVLSREALQMSMAEKVGRAAAVVDNSGTEVETMAQVRRLWDLRRA